ncbi:MAG: hypothetical protein CMM02_07560 [Rhodopirellula sp.]|nr:hypothetical protein [Rhodopirellula sp.]
MSKSTLTPEDHITQWCTRLEMGTKTVTVQNIVEARLERRHMLDIDNVNTDEGKAILEEAIKRSYMGLLYSILGLFPPAGNNDVNYADFTKVKAVYNNLARKLHPDKNQGGPDNTAEFQQVHQAYNLLQDELNGHLGADNGGDELKLITWTSHWHSAKDDPLIAVPKVLIESNDNMDLESGEPIERPHKRPRIGSGS